MADDNQQSTGAGVQKADSSTGQNQPPPSGQPKGGWSFGRPTTVHLGRPIIGEIVITNVAIEGEQVLEGANNSLQPYRRVVISGKNLKPLAGWGLKTVNGAPYDLQLSALDDDHISFYPAYHKGHIAPGTIVDMVFYVKDRAAQTYRLPFEFEYNSSDNKTQDKKGQGAGGSSGGAAAGGGGGNAIGAMIGDTIAGTAGALAEGLTGGGGSKATIAPAAAPAGKVKKPEEGGADDGGGGEEDQYDSGVEVEEPEQETVSPTSEVGGQTIASGTTVKQGAEIGISGTVQGFGGQTAVEGQQAAPVAGGPTSVRGTTEARGGGGRSTGSTVQVSGDGQTGQGNAEIEARQTIAEQAGGQAAGAAVSGKTDISGEAKISQNISGQALGGASAPGTVTGAQTVSASGAGAAQPLGVSGTVSGRDQISGKEAAETQIRPEGQLPQAPSPGGISGQQPAPTGAPSALSGTTSAAGTLNQSGTLGYGGSFSAGGGTGLGTMPAPAKPSPAPGQQTQVPEETGQKPPGEDLSKSQQPLKEPLAGGGTAPQEIIPQKGLGAVDAAVGKPLVMPPLSAAGREMAKEAGGELPPEELGSRGKETKAGPTDRLAPGGQGIGAKMPEGEGEEEAGGSPKGGPAGKGKPLSEKSIGPQPAVQKLPGEEPLPSGPKAEPLSGGAPSQKEDTGTEAATPEEEAPGKGLPGLAGKAPKGSATAGGAIAAEIGKTASSKIWYFGFASSAATWFSGLDFMIGGLVMASYWIFLHRKDPKLFPMKKWQKAVTYLAFIAPLFYLSVSISFIIYVGCNYPIPYSTSKNKSIIGLLYPSTCDAVMSATGGAANSFNPAPPATPTPPAAVVQPRGTP
jgi:hypothetical protein